MKKKLIASLLAGVMALSLVACGGTKDDAPAADGATQEGEMKVAMVTDSGDITDQSFNQTTYESAKAWSEEKGYDFTYYKPESDNDEARIASIDQAAADGANVVILPGFLFEKAIAEQADMYPEIKFVGLDIASGAEGHDNVYCATYQEEISGYLAGQMAVKSGYKHLGFLGGMNVPAVTRFGYGYVQGANDAAKELGIVDEVEVEYVCGGQFYGDADITAYMDTWYGTKGVEVVFACGGGIYTSAAEAAVKVDGGKVIGVDSDQSPIIDEYQEGLTLTSATKGLAATVKTILTAIDNGEWDKYAGKVDNLGIVSENPEENFVTLPIETTQWNDNFTEDDYLALVKDILDGKIEISSDIEAMPATDIKVTDYDSIK